MQGEGSDDMLMAAIAGGDQRSLRTLMERHMKSAIQLAERVLLSPGEADDVAQEAFFRVWKHAAAFDPGRARFTTWLYRIVLNLAIDRRRRTPAVPVESIEEPASPDADALQRVIERQEDEAMQAALGRLPEKQRAAIALFHFQGLSGREAAQAMNMSEKAFESLLIRARRALKQTLLGGQAA